MKHFCVILFLVVILFAWVCVEPLSVLAQSPSPTPPPVSTNGDQREFSISLAELDYEDTVLYGPFSTTNYYFGLPAHWQPLPGSYVTLDLEYRAQRVAEATSTRPPVLSTVTIDLDNHTLDSVSFYTNTQTSLQVPISAEVLAASQGERSRLTINLHVLGDCYNIKRVSLLIKDTSALHFAYAEAPIALDLAVYPYPFYQRSFEPDKVRFITPPQDAVVEMEAAVAMAARLGELTFDRMVISNTTSLEWDTQVGSDEHLIIVGKPETNSLIPWLNANTELPVPFRPRQMEMVTRGPASIVPSETFSLTVAVTNTADYTVSGPRLGATVPIEVEVTACEPECTEKDGTAHWSLAELAPGEASRVSLSLLVTQPITASTLEYAFFFSDDERGPLNVNSFTTDIAETSPPSPSFIARSGEGEYLFTYGDQAVAEGDGIIQEIISPWDARRAVLVVTGLTDDALRKASYALSARAEFPGMQGTSVLVQEVRPTPVSVPGLGSVDVTFADLGYDDEIVHGIRGQPLEFWLDMPARWRLTSEAYVRLLFSHSALIDYQESSLSILLNGTPIGSIALDESNVLDGSLQVPLPDSQIRHGRSNNLTVLVDMRLEDECYDPTASQIWTAIRRDSLLHLAHMEETELELSLDAYPLPFAIQPDLRDVAIVLAPAPGAAERDGVLRLAADLGSAAGGDIFNPMIIVGEPEDWGVLKDYHVIAVGRPSVNPAVAAVNEDLPQPFVPGTDQIEQVVDDVVFRLPSDLSLGYVQEIPSPWNEERAFLAVTGTTDEGVLWAVDALTRGDLVWRLEGNLALVRGEEIQSTDTRGKTRSGRAVAAATALPQLTPVGSPTPTQAAGTSTPLAMTTATPLPEATDAPLSPASSLPERQRPAWLLPLVITAGAVIVVILGVVAWQARRR